MRCRPNFRVWSVSDNVCVWVCGSRLLTYLCLEMGCGNQPLMAKISSSKTLLAPKKQAWGP